MFASGPVPPFSWSEGWQYWKTFAGATTIKVFGSIFAPSLSGAGVAFTSAESPCLQWLGSFPLSGLIYAMHLPTSFEITSAICLKPTRMHTGSLGALASASSLQFTSKVAGLGHLGSSARERWVNSCRICFVSVHGGFYDHWSCLLGVHPVQVDDIQGR